MHSIKYNCERSVVDCKERELQSEHRDAHVWLQTYVQIVIDDSQLHSIEIVRCTARAWGYVQTCSNHVWIICFTSVMYPVCLRPMQSAYQFPFSVPFTASICSLVMASVRLEEGAMLAPGGARHQPPADQVPGLFLGAAASVGVRERHRSSSSPNSDTNRQ